MNALKQYYPKKRFKIIEEVRESWLRGVFA